MHNDCPDNGSRPCRQNVAAVLVSTVELFDEEQHRLETWRTGAANRSTDRGQENSAAALVSAQWNSSTKNGTDETWRTGAANHRSTDRGQETVQRRWFPRTVELFDKEQHRLETWRTGAANHRSTDRGQENSAAALVSAHENSAAALVSAHSGTLRQRTDLRLGVRALLIIARLIVDKKTVQWRWFPRTVELFDEERYRLETWRNGAAHHRSTDCGRVDALVYIVDSCRKDMSHFNVKKEEKEEWTASDQKIRH
ncbi:hypothetical protein EVAR_19016_1 [Eumeta japonica]|uniref:Uncharacterized protein n=1 Tax=Eumeta variegata TaxID=151549 RepID=A0A4C1VAF2_EUMVA|nr:hypothetical protein EVAR_19016_1 [Eumeta japonica]